MTDMSSVATSCLRCVTRTKKPAAAAPVARRAPVPPGSTRPDYTVRHARHLGQCFHRAGYTELPFLSYIRRQLRGGQTRGVVFFFVVPPCEKALSIDNISTPRVRQPKPSSLQQGGNGDASRYERCAPPPPPPRKAPMSSAGPPPAMATTALRLRPPPPTGIPQRGEEAPPTPPKGWRLAAAVVAATAAAAAVVDGARWPCSASSCCCCCCCCCCIIGAAPMP
ncbi:unnamed protein product, partial [Ectocarpus sp. 12 AP-2014]